MDTNKTTLYVLIAGIIGINTTQKKLTTDGYVMNVYLYIILAILVASLAVVALDQYHILSISNYTGMKSLAMVVVIFVVLIALMMIDKKNALLRNILWLVFIIGMGIITLPIYQLSNQKNIVWKAVLTVIIIVIGLTVYASYQPLNYFDSWGTYLMVGLGALIVFQLLDYFFSDKTSMFSHQKIYAIIAIVIFSGFVLYDTKRIYQNAPRTVMDCQGQTNTLKCADYPGESLGLFLDILNLYTNVSSLQMQ